MGDADFHTLSVVRRESGVVVLTLDRPRSANAISAQLSRELYDCLQQFKHDPTVRVLVLTGAGRHFCAGADLRDPERDVPGWLDLGRRAVDTLAAMDLPVIAAINGTAVGGGLEVALACDIRIAQTGVKLGLPEIKIGALPGAGGLSRLQAVIGPPAAMTLVMSGRVVSAEEGQRLGLVSLAGEGESALGAAISLADELAQMAAYATRTAKLIFRQSLGQAPSSVMATEYGLIDRMATPEQFRAEERRAAERDPAYARIFAESASGAVSSPNAAPRDPGSPK
jgi:enoyl-CoA hydratase